MPDPHWCSMYVSTSSFISITTLWCGFNMWGLAWNVGVNTPMCGSTCWSCIHLCTLIRFRTWCWVGDTGIELEATVNLMELSFASSALNCPCIQLLCMVMEMGRNTVPVGVVSNKGGKGVAHNVVHLLVVHTVIHWLMTHHVTVIHQTIFLLACNTTCVFFFEINCSRSTKILLIHICCKLMELCFNTLKTSTFSIADLPNSGILNLFECI